jgi:hypothetical protein
MLASGGAGTGGQGAFWLAPPPIATTPKQPRLRPGDHVRIVRGAFVGLSGLVAVSIWHHQRRTRCTLSILIKEIHRQVVEQP